MRFTEKYTPIFVIVLIALVPIALWLNVQNMSFARPATVSAGVGELAGIVGAVLFALSLILSSRAPFLDKAFIGLNRLYAYHNRIGQIAFLLLLAHPLLLLARYAPDVKSAANFFMLSADYGQDFGILALALMILLIVLTLYLRPRYHFWRKLHSLFGVALFFGVFHALLSPSTVFRQSALLRWYVLAWMSIGVGVWIYRTLFKKTFAQTKAFTVAQLRALSAHTLEIALQTQGEKLRYKPGQFAFLTFRGAGIPTEKHPFSFVSHPNESNVAFAIKELGDFTSLLKDKLKIGVRVLLEGPFGAFSYTRAKQSKQLWLAGGVGITPFVSMAKDLKKNSYIQVQLIYSVKNISDAVYLDELERLQDELPNFSFSVYESDKNGFLTADVLAQKLPDLLERAVFLCAPPAMIDALRAQLLAKGMVREQIYSEEFNF